MALFDDIRGTLSSVSKEGMNKAREWKDQAKVAVEIKNMQSLIEKKYAEIGRAYYKDHKNDDAPAYTQMADVTEAFAKIQKLKKQQDEFRGIKRCSNCGGTIDTFANFCPCCGAKCEIEIPVVEPEEAAEPKETPEPVKEDVFEDAKEVVDEAVEETAEAVTGEVVDSEEAADAQEVDAE